MVVRGIQEGEGSEGVVRGCTGLQPPMKRVAASHREGCREGCSQGGEEGGGREEAGGGRREEGG